MVNRVTLATRAYRADSNNKYNEEKSRILRRIANGTKPRMATLTKYDISLEQVNAIRKKNKLSVLSYPLAMTTAEIQSINKQTERRIEETEKQKTLAVKAKESTKALEDKKEEMKQKFKDKIVEVPKEKLYDIQTINQFMYKNMNQSIKTKELHWGSPNNNFHGNLWRIFTRSNCDLSDIRKCLVNPQKLIDNFGGQMATKSRAFDSLSLALEYYPALDHLDRYKDVWDTIKKMKTSMKNVTQAEAIERRQNETISKSFSEMRRLVCEKYGENSNECLYMDFYAEVPSRDDLGNVPIYRKQPEKEPEGNYLILLKKKATFVLNKYKTKNIYGKIETVLSAGLRRRLLETQNKILFERKQNKMSPWVKKILEESGAKEEGDVGNITLLRKAFVSEKVNKKLSSKDRAELATSMKHSPLATLQYVRRFKEETEDNKETLENIKYEEGI